MQLLIICWWTQTIARSLYEKLGKKGALFISGAPSSFLLAKYFFISLLFPVLMVANEYFSKEDIFPLLVNLPDYSQQDNENGLFAWHESYHLQGLTDLFICSESDSLLMILLNRFENVLKNRDDFRTVESYHKQYTSEFWKGSASFPGWRNLHYQEGKPYSYFIHDALITAPMVQLALFLKNRPAYNIPLNIFLNEPIEDATALAELLYRKTAETIAGHEFKFINNAYHTFLSSKPGDYPLNFKSAVARLLFLMARYDENALIPSTRISYQVRFNTIFDDISSHLKPEEKLLFKYSNRVNSKMEDVSHGAITVRLIATLYENRHFLSNELRQKVDSYYYALRKTAEGLITGSQFHDPIFKNALIWDSSFYIDGTTPKDKSYHRSFAALWIPVADKEGAFFQKINENFHNYFEKLSPQDDNIRAHEFLGFVYLYCYGKKNTQ
jgi:hypothetical protein